MRANKAQKVVVGLYAGIYLHPNQHTAHTRSVSAITDAKIVLLLIKPIAGEQI